MAETIKYCHLKPKELNQWKGKFDPLIKPEGKEDEPLPGESSVDTQSMIHAAF